MEDQDLMQQLMATYLEELHDHVGSLGRELLALEKELDSEQRYETWTTIFRVAHTLKGASGMVNIVPVRDACHYMEEVFGYYRDHQEQMPEDLTSTMLQVVDAIEEMGSRLRSDDDLEGAPIFEFLPDLERMAQEIVQETEDEDDFEMRDALDSEAAHDEEVESEDPMASIHAELMPLFLDELDDHVSTLASDILALENAAGDEQGELLNKLFRAAHSLKGAARSVQLDVVESVCHRLEDLLSDLRDGKTALTTEIVSRVLETSDAIADAGIRLRQGNNLESAPIHAIEQKLTWDTDEPQGSQTAEPEPAPPAEPVVEETAASATTSPGEPIPAAATSEKAGDSAGTKSAPTKTEPATPVAIESTTKAAAKPRKQASVKPPTRGKGVADQASIRVAAQKLDALLAHSGELLVARGRFDLRAKAASELRDLAVEVRNLWNSTQRAVQQSDALLDEEELERAVQMKEKLTDLSKKLDALSSGMEADNRLLGQTCNMLDEEIYNVRMLPFSDACGGLERAVRDISKTTNKEVTLKIEGADVEVDRSVLEGLKDPLLHLVRNAVDHGIESVKERLAAGKTAAATVTVSASLRGGQVEVRVADDGAGFNLARIRAIAEKRGIEIPDDTREQARLVFAPGFSTAKLITDISGRGVGLDVVQSQVESLHGDVDVSFEVGKGTRFTLMVPLTLTTIRSMLVQVSEQIYAIPTTAVHRLVRFNISDVHSSAGRDTLLLREAPTRLVSLASTLGLKSKGLVSGKSTKGLAVVLATSDQRVALAVDEVMSEQEVLVKNLGARIRRLRHFSGCTLLPTGRIALVMNAANVVRSALGTEVRRSILTEAKQDSWVRKQLLLADDSVTTRTLLKNILETAGYDVVAASDGQHAWEIAQEQTFDAVVTDVDMPRMTGFDLTEKLRGYETTANLPIVLVTARGTDQDKEQGVKVGANAYIVKGTFEQQNLLDTLAQLV